MAAPFQTGGWQKYQVLAGAELGRLDFTPYRFRRNGLTTGIVVGCARLRMRQCELRRSSRQTGGTRHLAPPLAVLPPPREPVTPATVERLRVSWHIAHIFATGRECFVHGRTCASSCRAESCVMEEGRRGPACARGGTFVVIADSVRSSPAPGVRGMLLRGMMVTLAIYYQYSPLLHGRSGMHYMSMPPPMPPMPPMLPGTVRQRSRALHSSYLRKQLLLLHTFMVNIKVESMSWIKVKVRIRSGSRAGTSVWASGRVRAYRRPAGPCDGSSAAVWEARATSIWRTWVTSCPTAKRPVGLTASKITLATGRLCRRPGAGRAAIFRVECLWAAPPMRARPGRPQTRRVGSDGTIRFLLPYI